MRNTQGPPKTIQMNECRPEPDAKFFGQGRGRSQAIEVLVVDNRVVDATLVWIDQLCTVIGYLEHI
eukprot:CAMPEP_0206526886 /NCGR_PEP_ID=MMETSP0325_2-20121206/1009_1 /ASSEMBLY_ACC=CAM_ASM_000347 /TAXON_ID=2866 /ORGANISM="Crypthecodinium cohnii, Strain Seligo" /LENGTH=65 /DNA_ID=CAMNT_0054022169 /DNA_START=886 /DNA_END=1083 /DNA_ORIENTATION=-